MQKIFLTPCAALFPIFYGCSGGFEAAPLGVRQKSDLARDAQVATCDDLAEDAGKVQALRINEVVVDPPGADANNEYIELAGTACGSLSSMYLMSIEGDSESNPGMVDKIFDLAALCGGSGCHLGADGLLIVTAINGWSKPGGSASTWVGTTALVGGGLENGTATLLLLECSQLPVSRDWDPANSGVLQLPAGCALLDSLAWLDRAEGDFPYSESVLGPKPAAGAAVRCEPSSAGVPSWYFGSLGMGADGIAFTGTLAASAPPDAMLTPGLPNQCPGLAGERTSQVNTGASDAAVPSAVSGSGGAYAWWQLDVPGSGPDAATTFDAGFGPATGGARATGARPNFSQPTCSTTRAATHSSGWGIALAAAALALRGLRKSRR